MHGPTFIQDLAIVLGVAGLTGLLFHRLKQPNILGYLLAGLLVRAYLLGPDYVDPEHVHTLSEFGVVLVMFAVGLEFRLEKFIKVLPTAGVTALVEISILFGAGVLVGRSIGWGPTESLFLGACVCISSTMAVSKILTQRPVPVKARELVFSVLVLQDVAAVALIAVMTAIARGADASFVEVLGILGKLILTLLFFIAIGMFIVPRFVRSLVRTKSSEAIVVGCVGLCFAMAVLAERVGYSVALGAFIAGVLVAESGHGHKVEQLSSSVRDVFAAVFFVSVGMTVDPALALQHLPVALLVLLTVVVAQFFGVLLGGLLSGSGLQRSVTAGISLGQIGEFAFIIAGIGMGAGVVPKELVAVLVVVAVLSVFTSSLLLRFQQGAIDVVERVLPSKLLRMIGIYESWLDQMRTRAPGASGVRSRLLPSLLIDLLIMVGITLAWRTWRTELGRALARVFGFGPEVEDILATGALMVALLPPLVPLALGARTLATRLADRVFDEQKTNEHALLRAVFGLIATLCAGLPLALFLGPIVGTRLVWPALGGALAIGGFLAWRKAARWDEEMTSGGLLVLKTIANQGLPDAHEERRHSISGFANLKEVTLRPDSYAVGKTLTELHLRAATGASVVGVGNQQSRMGLPDSNLVLAAGDTLLLAGSGPDQSVAELLLHEGAAPSDLQEAEES